MKEKKHLKILKYITIGLFTVLVVEGIYFGIKMIKIRKDSTYYSSITSIIKSDKGYVGVGLSDYKYSKFNKYIAPGYNKPYIWIYDNNLNIINEVKFAKGYNGVFNDIIKVNDGYIVIGNIEMSEYNHKNSTTEGIIIKYDKDFNLVWRKNYDLLGVTSFNSVKELEDGSLLVAGSSIYENDVIGNHTNGGAIIVKFSNDGKVLLELNNGGPRTGSFNDIEIVPDGFITVGVKSSGTGIIYKYNFDGKELWHNYYGYTDSKGLTSITKVNDNDFIITGSKLTEKDKTNSYKAALIKINANGEIIKSITYEKSAIARFEDSIILNHKILVIGVYGQQVDKVLDNDSILVTYDENLEKQTEKEYFGNNKYTLTKINANGESYVIVGNTNSKVKELKTNGKDYYQLIVKE